MAAGTANEYGRRHQQHDQQQSREGEVGANDPSPGRPSRPQQALTRQQAGFAITHLVPLREIRKERYIRLLPGFRRLRAWRSGAPDRHARNDPVKPSWRPERTACAAEPGGWSSICLFVPGCYRIVLSFWYQVSVPK
jgi:hypothetical protein